MASPSTADSTVPLGRGALRGRRVAQVLFFAALVWVIVSGAAQILAEGMFAKRVAHDGPSCRAELASLRARLADAALLGDAAEEPKSELAAVAAFRQALGGEAGRAWDVHVQELIDGCPRPESDAAYALARLRASHEAMVRLDVQQAAPARAAYRRANALLPKDAP